MPKGSLTESQLVEYTRVAYYYYKEGATQEQIAGRMKMSRQRVNRILRDCLAQGIVQISIANLDTVHLEMESRIKRKYDLLDIRVIDSTGRDISRDVGIAGGNYLASILQDGDIVGFTRGRTLAEMAEHMPAVHKNNLTAVQLMGSRNQEHQQTAANEIVHNFSKRLGSKYYMLFAPIIVSNAELKRSLQQDPIFSECYQVIRSCKLAVAGIGTRQSLTLFPGEPDPAGELAEVVGELGTHLFDAQGRPVPSPYRDRVIAVELEDYKRIPVRIGVAGSPEKAEAIHAALLGKYVNVLVTDYETARMLEEL